MKLIDLINRAPSNIQEAFIQRSHQKNTSIIFPQEKNNYLYILLSGKADVIIENYNGLVTTLYNYGAYSCFGELELFTANAQTFDVVCLTDCETIAVHKEVVFHWMQYDFEFTKYIIEQLAEKLLKNTTSLSNISLLNVKDRVLNCIYLHYKNGNLSTLTKNSMCSETFVPIRSLNRAIAELKHEGLINYSNKKFSIISIEKLEDYCKSII